MQGQFWCKVWWTGIKHTEKGKTEIARLGAECMFLVPRCFSRAIRAAEIPPNFRLATGVSKFTGESKPDTWLEDYRVTVQIGGGNDEVAMKHLPLMLEGSARAWLNQLAPGSIFS